MSAFGAFFLFLSVDKMGHNFVHMDTFSTKIEQIDRAVSGLFIGTKIVKI